MEAKKEKLFKVLELLAEFRKQRIVHAGESDVDYLFKERVHSFIDLFLAWLEFELE